MARASCLVLVMYHTAMLVTHDCHRIAFSTKWLQSANPQPKPPNVKCVCHLTNLVRNKNASLDPHLVVRASDWGSDRALWSPCLHLMLAYPRLSWILHCTTPMLQRDASAISTVGTTLAKAAPMPHYDASQSSTAGTCSRENGGLTGTSTSTSRLIKLPGPSPLGAGMT